MSATVLEALRAGLTYQVRPLGAVTLRGKNQTVDLYDVQPICSELLAINDVSR